jgi:hypothetical protein
MPRVAVFFPLTDRIEHILGEEQPIERFVGRHCLRIFVLRKIAFHLKVVGYRVVHTCPFSRINDALDVRETGQVAVVAARIAG